MTTPTLSRRTFLIAGTALAASPWLRLPIFAAGPNETLNVAHVGVGGMGRHDLGQVASAQKVRVVALCDVDSNNLGHAKQQHSDAQTYSDYRRMFDAMASDIDAVVVSTPDHMHGPVAIAAMQLGKHVYAQKPIAHNLRECRTMAELASSNKLVTQMGTQIHSHAAYRTAVATLRTGVIGKVSEAHLWVSKSWGGPVGGRPSRQDPVPEHLDWDSWIGVAPERPYVEKLYHSANWRGWKDFGCGTLGDMGCHIFDPVFSALELGAPSKVVSRGPQHYEETFATDSDIVYEFPGSPYTTDTVTFRWTDGRVTRPDASRAQLPEGVELPGAGSFLVGDKGVAVIPHIGMPRFYRNGDVLEVPLESREHRNHYHEWTDACRGEGETSTPFAFSGPLTEAVLVGTIAGRFKDEELHWDSTRLKFDHVGATALVTRNYRPGREVSTSLSVRLREKF